MKRLIISDLHIGSYFSKEKDIIKLLENTNYDELILAGDIIDFIKIPKFTEDSLKIFDLITNLNIPIIYIIGNHDIAFKNFNNKNSKNLHFTKCYNFIDNNKKIRIEHGDDYDSSLIKWEHIMNIICVIANLIERFFNFDLTNYWEKYRNNKRNKIDIENIIKKNNDIDVFIMGHTHRPEIVNIEFNNKNILYCNSGDWVTHKSYLTLEDGNIELHNL